MTQSDLPSAAMSDSDKREVRDLVDERCGFWAKLLGFVNVAAILAAFTYIFFLLPSQAADQAIKRTDDNLRIRELQTQIDAARVQYGGMEKTLTQLNEGLREKQDELRRANLDLEKLTQTTKLFGEFMKREDAGAKLDLLNNLLAEVDKGGATLSKVLEGVRGQLHVQTFDVTIAHQSKIRPGDIAFDDRVGRSFIQDRQFGKTVVAAWIISTDNQAFRPISHMGVLTVRPVGNQVEINGSATADLLPTTFCVYVLYQD